MAGKINTLPRWLIFTIDLSCVCFAIIVSRIIRYNFDLLDVGRNISAILLMVAITNATLFFMFRSYAGIVRYTDQKDSYRLISLTLCASFVYSIVVSVYRINGHTFLSYATIAINFFISSSVLIGYRVLVRYIFKAFFSEHLKLAKDRLRAAIFNAGEQGLITKRVIGDYPQSHLKVIAFLDDVSHRHGKMMEGLPIYTLDDAGFKKLKQDKVDLIIIANKDASKDRLNTLVDLALKHSVRLQQVPPIQQWLHGKLGSEQLRNLNIEDLLEREVIKVNNENIHYVFKGKKILVTGAAGSIGSELVRQLIPFHPSLILLCDIAESPLHELNMELQESFPNAQVKSYIGDICDKVRMELLFEIYNPDIIFHAAAYKHVPLMEANPSIAVLNNVLGTKILAEFAVNYNVEKFVMISTDKAVNPTNIMGASKRIAEIYTQSFFKHIQQTASLINNENINTTRFITTRFGNVLGSNGSVLPRFKQQLEKGGPITVTHPDITRYFMTISEACQLVIEAGAMGQGGEIFVFDMGEPVKIVDLAHKMIRLSGQEPDVDIPIVFTGLRPGEKLYEELLNNAENTLPTYHEKIMIAQVREYDFPTIKSQIEKLISCARKHYTHETVSLMKEIVPEFISNNSTFESLDVNTNQ